MNNQWTDEQLAAVSSRGGNLLVSAAAGAGKTSVLVERIIRRVTDPVDPVDVDRLLVVTFTNAAASEVRERIGRALAGEMARRPGSTRLSRQLAMLNRASISTLHSFCLDLLRQYFYLIDLDPAFRVADADEAALIQAGTLEELFERRYAAGDNALFTGLVDCYGGKRDDTALQEMVLAAYNFARSTPDPSGWLNRLPENFDLPDDTSFDQFIWCGVLKKSLAMELDMALSSIERALHLAGSPGGPAAYLDNLRADREMIEGLLRRCRAGVPWAELHRQFNSTVFGKLKGQKKEEAGADTAEAVRKLRDSAKKKVGGLIKEFFPRPPEELCRDLRGVAPLVRELCSLVLDFGESYRKAKAARCVVDFNDLEYYALQILAGQGGHVPSHAALSLRERFEEVLVDEYQDINAVQEAIIQLVSRQGEPQPNLFMVGDVKQSIYRFRLADPGLFLKKYLSYPARRGGPEQRIELARNFRSREGLISAVNFIFRQVMTPTVGEIAYDRGAELVCGADYPAVTGQPEPDSTVELYLIERDSTEQGDDLTEKTGADDAVPEEGQAETEEELDATQKEARLIARRIGELLRGEGEGGLSVFDRATGSYRPAAYRDVVVLLRATAGYANTFVEEFRQAGIPAYAELATGYFEATEVETMLALLKVIDNPRQDIPLAAVLRSPLAGLNAGDLARIRLASRRGDFLDAVVAASLSGEGELADRLLSLLQKLEKWRSAARQGSLADLIWSIYRETGYYDFVGGLPGGGQRQANLRALHHRARQYEASAFRGLFLFLRFIERIREGGRDLGAGRALSEKENVVRIMSIHKSKGLEFPVVFVAGLGKKFNFSDLNKDVLFHKELGFGPQLVDAEARLTYPTMAKLAIRQQLKMETLAEEMRILYVALTRAREKLILVGSVRNLKNHARRWCSLLETADWQLPDGFLAGAATNLDWLVPALARHRDGAAIRKTGQSEGSPPVEVAADSSRWSIFFEDSQPRSEKARPASAEFLSLVSRMQPLAEEGPQAGVVKSRLDWSYPFAAAVGRASKTSITELKRRFDQRAAQEDESLRDFRPAVGRRPLFLQETQGLTAAERGSALHLVLQNLDLRGSLTPETIKSQIESMVLRELLTSEQADSVPVPRITSFFASRLGRRVLSAREVLREMPFTLVLPASEVYPELTGLPGETVMVQGVVDCLADEGDGYLLLDYKTDRLAPEQLDQALSRYRVQLDIYARAVKNITGRKVKEKYLYLFNAGTAIKCD
ncbi:ATP-dependent helicase/nuclease subunit A [Pelotomaculum propionicicum]|uniref:ATP-dependent helicase/nuclease subunit A n=1 Tax=Pelotomaculum propionicicum TaxID=258475 RepID=A0A4Y7RJI1_9FIRM|nr:helicase-exonuclease AddAB subunit AddA [Pelotomaculum propionicicum]TEB08976.1 ATP-dependent helicase/nuclease subunit A [Pelotomaculum propionicicum]